MYISLYAYAFLSTVHKQLVGSFIWCYYQLFYWYISLLLQTLLDSARDRDLMVRRSKALAFDKVSKQQLGDELNRVLFIILPIFEKITNLPYHHSVSYLQTIRRCINM